MGKAVALLLPLALNFVLPGAGTIASTLFSGAGVFTSTQFLIAQGIRGALQIGIGAAFSSATKSKQDLSNTTALPLIEGVGVSLPARETTNYRELVYGRIKKSGTVLFETSRSSGVLSNGDTETARDAFLHQIIGVAAHEIDGFEKFYIDNRELTIDSNGWVQNSLYTKNTDTFTPKGVSGVNAAFTSDDATGSGTAASIYINYAHSEALNTIKAGDYVTISGFADAAYNGSFPISSIATHDSGSATRVNYTTDSTITTSPISQTGVSFQIAGITYKGGIAYAHDNEGHGLNAGDKLFLFDAKPIEFELDNGKVESKESDNTFSYIPDGVPSVSTTNSGVFKRMNGTNQRLVQIQAFKGSDSQDLSSEPKIQEFLAGQFVSTDRFKGIACIYARFFDAGEFRQTPQLSALIRGKKVYDYRDGSLGFSRNFALCLFDYLTWKGTDANEPFSLGLNYNNGALTSTRLDLSYWRRAADICDEQVQKADGSYLRRYTMDGTLQMGEFYSNHVTDMLNNCGGAITRVSGKYRLHVAAYELPVHNIDEKWLVDDVSISIVNDRQDLVNTLTGVFIDDEQNYKGNDTPIYTDTQGVIDDGEVFKDDIKFKFLHDTEYAQRMLKLYTKLRRRKMTVQLPLAGQGLRLAVNDNVSLNLPYLSFSDKIFKVDSIRMDMAAGNLQATLVEDKPEYYEWDFSVDL